MVTKRITVGEKEFMLYPCPIIGLVAIGAKFAEIGTGSVNGTEALVDGIYYGVKRGLQDDPAVTRTFFEWNIDSTNAAELIQAFAEVNGATTKETPQGEA
jgi:hypothetical protein